jgi:hypothetical protein
MEEHGYCKGTEQDDRGRVCAYGAIIEATDGDSASLRDLVAREFSEYLAETRRTDRQTPYGSDFTARIFNYNDSKHRRGKDVVKALKDCATRLGTPSGDKK